MVLGCEVGNVDQALLEPVAVEGFAAGASHHAVRLPRRQLFAGLPQGIFLCRPVALISPFLKIRLGAPGQEHAPCGFEVVARLVERRRCRFDVRGDGIQDKTRNSSPTCIGWIARADRDRADKPNCATVSRP
jgi:hypothetical protein